MQLTCEGISFHFAVVGVRWGRIKNGEASLPAEGGVGAYSHGERRVCGKVQLPKAKSRVWKAD